MGIVKIIERMTFREMELNALRCLLFAVVLKFEF